jgi:hypothetical protein
LTGVRIPPVWRRGPERSGALRPRNPDSTRGLGSGAPNTRRELGFAAKGVGSAARHCKARAAQILNAAYQVRVRALTPLTLRSDPTLSAGHLASEPQYPLPAAVSDTDWGRVGDHVLTLRPGVGIPGQERPQTPTEIQASTRSFNKSLGVHCQRFSFALAFGRSRLATNDGVEVGEGVVGIAGETPVRRNSTRAGTWRVGPPK